MAKIMSINVHVYYEDLDGSEQVVSKTGAQTFEGAIENLGKLERFIRKLNQN